MKVHLTRDQRIRVLNTEAVYNIMQQILLRENKIGRNKEHFWIVCLSNLDRIMLIELLSLGTENATLVNPTEVFSFALQKQAKKLIMVHNHPDEVVLLPSDADMDLTNHMYQVGKFLNLPVLDHLIINEKKFLSFANTHVLERLARSKKYVLQYKEEAERLKERGRKEGWLEGKKEGLEEGLEKGLKAGEKFGLKKGEEIGIKKGEEQGLKKGQELKAVQMAKGMKKEGIDTKIIAKLSGLSIARIKEL
jgi:DNA repair protein RadC